MKRRIVCAACFCLCLGIYGCGGDDSSKAEKPGENVPENTEALCSDGLDNDNNGKKDCEEDDCQWFENCATSAGAENTEALCTDGIDNDNNGKKDCEEDDCQWFEACATNASEEDTEVFCSDGLDNDNDGKTDCEEESCQEMHACKNVVVENTPELCADGRDNDNDGEADCSDSGCRDLSICFGKEPETTEALCSDGADNDMNGRADCDDANCVQFSICQKEETTEALCSDGIDNDHNGLKDCAEESCKSFKVCDSGQTACTEGAGSCASNYVRSYCQGGEWQTETCDIACIEDKCVTCEGAYGADSCEDGVYSYCSGNQRLTENCKLGCEENRCLACIPGEMRCGEDGSYREICETVNGVSQWVSETCQNDKACLDGECRGCETIGKKECSAGIKKTCNSNYEYSIENCEYGCDDAGDCRVCKEGRMSCGDDGNSIMKCVNNKLEKAGSCSTGCVNGTCNDENGNHLKDEFEPNLKKGSSCIESTSCSSGMFCDSFIGKCADKCTSSEQCVDGYACRPDGRCAAEAFETVWKTTSANQQIWIPTKNAKKCNFKIDWGDGKTETVSSCNASNVSHKYASAGEHHVKITGTYEGFSMDDTDSSNRASLIEVVAFGPVGLGAKAFRWATGLNKLSEIDIPDSTKYTSTDYMFESCSSLQSGVGKWDMSPVTSMEGMFSRATKFNEDLDRWNVANVKNMKYMFNEAKAFNGNIENWRTNNVTDMSYMFNSAIVFNRNIGGWNVGNVTDMSWMFYNAAKFNALIDDWNTSKVTSMREMFELAVEFNRSIDSWDVSNVTTMQLMFASAKKFNKHFKHWNTSKVTNMYGMFQGAEAFNGDISTWNTSSVTDMRYMFDGAKTFNQAIGSWKTSNVTSMKAMFRNANDFNKDIGSWNTSKVTDMSYMFYKCEGFIGVGSWDTSNVTNMSYMFYYAGDSMSDLSKWNTSKVTDMNHMFSHIRYWNGSEGLSKWDVSKVKNFQEMFSGSVFFNLDLTDWKPKTVRVSGSCDDVHNMFWGTWLSCSKVDSIMKAWFEGALSCTSSNAGCKT